MTLLEELNGRPAVTRCNGCGHVGDRTFAQNEKGEWRDVLGGALGVRPEDCICTYCDSSEITLIPKPEAP